MLRGVRAVEGADLERLCGATHRGFESLPLSQFPLFLMYHFYTKTLKITYLFHILETFKKLLHLLCYTN